METKREIFFKKDYSQEKCEYFNKINSLVKNESIVDYGGGDGKILELLDIKNKYIVDIKKRNNNIPFFKPGEFKDKVDIVLCSMALHHIKDINSAILDMNNILKDEGVLIIREADCKNNHLKNVHYQMDKLYYENIDNIVLNHKSREEWESILSKKFTLLNTIYEEENPFSVYWQVYKKN